MSSCNRSFWLGLFEKAVFSPLEMRMNTVDRHMASSSFALVSNHAKEVSKLCIPDFPSHFILVMIRFIATIA